MTESSNQILCITNSYAYKTKLRSILSSHQEFSIIFLTRISEAMIQIESRKFSVILIDESIVCKNQPTEYKELLSLISSLCIIQNTLILVPKLCNECFSKYIGLGFTYIADIQMTEYMLPAILKSIEEVKSQRLHPEKITYKGLTIYPNLNIVILNHCRICITSAEMQILNFLIGKEKYYDFETIHRYMKFVFGKDISSSYVTVNIHRLSKSIKDATGMEIIKNRYGVGYYLVL